MSNNEFEILLNKNEKDLINICNKFSLQEQDRNDLIQDLYLKCLTIKNIDRYLNENHTPNMFIIYTMLKNSILNFLKYNKKTIHEYDFSKETIEPEFIDERYELILNVKNNFNYWFDRQILELYIYRNMKIREIEKETGIKFRYIQSIIHKFLIKCKKIKIEE